MTDYSENSLVEQPAIQIYRTFAACGATVPLYYESRTPDLTSEEREEVKKVAHQLLERLHALLVLDWRKRASTWAQVRLAIEDTLDEGLPRAYTKELYQSKCVELFEHVYESYYGDGGSLYKEAA